MTKAETTQEVGLKPDSAPNNGGPRRGKPGKPTVLQGDLVEALDWAQVAHEPALVPVPVYTDDRGWSVMNQMQGVLSEAGQINFSMMYPGVVKAWHRHQEQTDFWLCLLGHLKVGIYRERDGRAWQVVVGEKQPLLVVIPPTLWHGAATVGPESAGLLYYVTHRYDPQNPDEQRRSFDSVPGFDWGVQNR